MWDDEQLWKTLVVPVEGIEPTLLAEHDFEFVRVYQFRHTGIAGLLYSPRPRPSIAGRAANPLLPAGKRGPA